MSTMFDIARKNMVDSQLRPNKVTDLRLIAAMSSLPREAFLPAELASRAYADENIRLGHGRVMLAPMAIARLAQEAALESGERVLLIGAGSGYSAAILANTGAKIFAVEDDTNLLGLARTNLAAYAPDATLIENPLAAGWSTGAPYDCIIIEGAVSTLPSEISAQLAPTGRIVMVQDRGARIGVAVLGVKSGSDISFAAKFDCVAAVVPGFAKEAAFSF